MVVKLVVNGLNTCKDGRNWSCFAHSCHMSHKVFLLLTHFTPMFHLYTSWKSNKTSGFLTFSGGIQMEHGGLGKMVLLFHVTLQFVKNVFSFQSIFWTRLFVAFWTVSQLDRIKNIIVISVSPSFSWRSFPNFFRNSLHVLKNQILFTNS